MRVERKPYQTIHQLKLAQFEQLAGRRATVEEARWIFEDRPLRNAILAYLGAVDHQVSP